MAFYLWQLIRDVYNELGQLQVASATGGSTTTIVDTKLIGTGKDDDWKGGAVVVLSAGGVAPEGEFARVSAYSDSSGTLTFPALTAAPESGDLYGLVSEYYPLEQMIEIANLALTNLGDLVYVDTTTLDTADNKTEYAASAAWKRRRPRRIDIQGYTNDTDDNRWIVITDWEYVPAAAGSTGLIIFRQQPPSGRDIRVWYDAPHERVSAYNDVINEAIHPQLAIAAVTEKALVWQLSRLDGQNEFMMQRLNDARSYLSEMRKQHVIWKPRVVHNRLTINRRYYQSDELDSTVRL